MTLAEKISLTYVDGQLVFKSSPSLNLKSLSLPERLPAYKYREIMENQSLVKSGLLVDHAKSYEISSINLRKSLQPRDHQVEAFSAWFKSGSRGVVELPTGAGKSILAVMAMLKLQRPSLVVVPTLDLVDQWRELLGSFFDSPIGQLYAGKFAIEYVTVGTYDSVCNKISEIGGRFSFLIVDECHHLPSNQYRKIATHSIAPFRLGLSATVRRGDGRERELFNYMGPLVYRKSILDMGEDTLSPYQTHTVKVELTNEERQEYEHFRQVYLTYLKANDLKMGGRNGWQEFLRSSSQGREGRQAYAAYLKQKDICFFASEKINAIWDLLKKHQSEKILIFTDNNLMAYRIAECLFLPVISHKTKKTERKQLLEKFATGDLDVLVTSKVLNEGVDVPDASVAIIASGSGVVREHVQRLGRILRRSGDKQANLYEIITDKTIEMSVKSRRRKHEAYQG